jgi:hypothetical protein
LACSDIVTVLIPTFREVPKSVLESIASQSMKTRIVECRGPVNKDRRAGEAESRNDCVRWVLEHIDDCGEYVCMQDADGLHMRSDNLEAAVGFLSRRRSYDAVTLVNYRKMRSRHLSIRVAVYRVPAFVELAFRPTDRCHCLQVSEALGARYCALPHPQPERIREWRDDNAEHGGGVKADPGD